jgi:hypothetical protein
MCGEMVRAILEGRKTQTRRLVKFDIADHIEDGYGSDNLLNPKVFTIETDKGRFGLKQFCPYAVDRLWVKETWCVMLKDGNFLWNKKGNHKCHYRADGYEVVKDDGYGGQEFRQDGTAASPWQPSIFMSRWASRINLAVTNIRIERLQDISEEDAIAEGIPNRPAEESNRDEFADLWDSINGKKKGCAWNDNPWVWVVEFKQEDR